MTDESQAEKVRKLQRWIESLIKQLESPARINREALRGREDG